MTFMDLNFRLFTNSSLQRGLDYFQKGKVGGLSYKDLTAKSMVMGEREYKVSVTFNKNGKIARATCTCPYSFSGYCKHIAATVYELDYQKSEGFLEEEGRGDDLLTDAEKFSKECYNESYRITYDTVPDFYKRKEEEILSRGAKWSERELIDNISYLYSLRLPMAVGENSYSRYLRFMEGKEYSLKVKKETFSQVYSRYPYYNFLKEALENEEFREVVNLLLSETISETTGLRSSIIYNIDDAGDYLSEDNLMALLTKTGPYAVNRESLLRIFIRRDFEKGIETFASYRYLSGDELYCLATYYEGKGDKEKSKSFYKKMLSKSRDLPFDAFISYWKSLSDEEKLREYPSLYEAARNSKHDKAFAVLVGRGKKGDLRGLTIDDFLILHEEVKKQFPEEYLSVLLPRVEKKMTVNGYTQLTFPDCLPLFEHYPLLLSSLVKKRNPNVLHWFQSDLKKRYYLLILMREFGLLKDMRIHAYKEGE